MTQIRLRGWAALLCFISVSCGAFGAHALKNKVAPADLQIWQTAVTYLFFHGLSILYLSDTRLYKICYFFLIGCLFFSGSLFLLVLTNARWLGAVTPIGGVLFLIGWIQLMYFSFFKKIIGNSKNESI